jgi:HlyD family secretion protein
MVIEVRGPGTLVAEQSRWITASTDGRVEQIHVLPGSLVSEDTVLMWLGNPELEREALDAELQLEQSMAELEDLEVELLRRSLEQEALAATTQADYVQRTLKADLNSALAREGLISELNLKLSRLGAEEAEKRHLIEQKRLHIDSQSVVARIKAKQSEIARLETLYELRRRQVEMLRVRAGIAGILQQTSVEVGQQVQAGSILGKVSVPGKLKAELKIPETQAKDIVVGLPAAIDTHNGIVAGKVIRIDPAVQQGTVRVDVSLPGGLTPGARPDLNVYGTIQIDRLDNVLKMGRPSYGLAYSTVGVYRLGTDGRDAVRVPVQLGRTSVTTVQVLGGLDLGDQVILSDTSSFDKFEKIRLD